MKRTWKTAVHHARLEAIKPPEGADTIESIAAQLGMSEDRARDEVNRLIRRNEAERISGKRMTESGAVVPATYYRLLPVKPKSSIEHAPTPARRSGKLSPLIQARVNDR